MTRRPTRGGTSKSRRGFRGGVAAASVLALALAGCGSPSSGGDDSTYLIGAALAQTGDLAILDQPVLRGFQLAIDEINAKGGLGGKHKVELKVIDTRSDPAQAAVATQQLVQDQAKLVLEPTDADPAIAGGVIAQQAKIPALSVASTPSMTQNVGDFMFSGYASDNVVSSAVAKYALGKGYKSAFLISSPDTAYTQNVPKYFEAAFVSGGGQIAGRASVGMSQQDFNSEITRLKSINPPPDVIETSLYEPALPPLLKQLRAAGVQIPVLGNDGSLTDTVRTLGPAVTGLVLPTITFPTANNGVQTFYDKITTKYDATTANSYSDSGYNLGYVVDAAVTNAASTDPVKVRDALAALQKVPGATADISYLPNRFQKRTIYLVEIQADGQYEQEGAYDLNESEIAKP
jgi:branched-chain amino acid transport system substrate-binding protein